MEFRRFQKPHAFFFKILAKLGSRLKADPVEIHRSKASNFRALKEILLAGDANRLVAELTFVPRADVCHDFLIYKS